MKKRIVWLCMCLVMCAYFNARSGELLLKEAPPLFLKTLLQSQGKTLAELPGKVIVIEFWGTYCTPCLANLQHLNSLSQHFADSNVLFISISNEEPEKVKQFLAKRKLNGWVGIDSANITFNAYGVTGLPATFVADARGIIQYTGRPEDLDEATISDIRSGKYTAPPGILREKEPVFGSFGGGDDPVFTAHFNAKLIQYQNIIRHSTGMGGSGYKGYNGMVGISILHHTTSAVVSFLADLPSAKRVINLSSIPDTTNWDVVFYSKHAGDREKAFKTVTALFKETVNIDIVDSAVSFDVWLPDYGNSSKALKEKNIDFDAGTAYSLRSLAYLFSLLEDKSETIVAFPADAATYYIDVFEVMNTYYTMPATDLKKWLETQGISFREAREQVAVKVLHNN